MHRTLRLALGAASALLLAALPAGASAARMSLPPGGEGATAANASADLVLPKSGPLVVTRSGKVQRGEYLRPPLGPDARGGVIVLEKLDGVTLDLSGVVLRGAPIATPLDHL